MWTENQIAASLNDDSNELSPAIPGTGPHSTPPPPRISINNLDTVWSLCICSRRGNEKEGSRPQLRMFIASCVVTATKWRQCGHRTQRSGLMPSNRHTVYQGKTAT